MTNKGTGWVPDFPDVKDYTLNSNAIEALASQVQTDQITESVEGLTQQVSNALKLLKSQSTQPETDRSRQLNSLIEKLDRKASGGIHFAPAKIDKSLKPGMSSPEVMKVKIYLRDIFPGMTREEYGFHFNQVFDEITKLLIEDFQASRGIPVSGIVDNETMDALEWSFNTKNTGDFEKFCQNVLPPGGYVISNAASDLDFSINEQEEEPLTFDSLKRKIIKIKDDVANVRGYLERHQLLNPLIDDWLNLSDSENELAAQLIKLEEALTILQDSRTIVSTSIDSINTDIKTAMGTLRKKLCKIPAALNPQDLPNTSPLIRNIPVPIPDSLLEIVVKKLLYNLPNFNFEEFIKPVAVSVIFSMSSDAGSDLSYIPDESSSKKAKNYINEGIRRLSQQLYTLGILLPDASFLNGFNEISERIKFALDQFRKKYGIATDNLSDDLLCEQVSNAVQTEIGQLFYPIAKVICQSIMPIGKHSNFQKAVEEGIEEFNKLVGRSKEWEEGEKKLKQLLLKMIQEGTPETAGFLKETEPTSKKLHLKYSAFMAVRETVEKIENNVRWANDNNLKYQENKLHYGGNIPLYTAICNVVNGYLELDSPLTDNKEIKLEDTLPEKQLLQIVGPTEQVSEVDLKIPINWNLGKSLGQPTRLSLPDFVDLSLWCSSIEDQGDLNSCTAQAGVALTEYFAKKSSGHYIDVSSLFLYKATRNLMQREGDSGASVRETMKAMVLFGIPPEEHWPYDEANYDKEPTSFCYSFAQNYQAIKYFRLDHAGIANNTLLIQIKAVLVAGFPCMFGFTIYTSIHKEANIELGHIPYPDQFDKMEGGHAVVAVGYDDHRVIENADGKQSKGAILIRNSWGTDWGEGGYGWLPYDYVLAGLTADWWSLFQSEWFESGKFGVGASHWKSGMGGNRGGW